MKPENRPKIAFEGREYDDYQAAQMQRKLERTIRKQKRLKAAYKAAGLDEDAAAAGSRLNILNQKYHAFSRAAGLPTQPERMKALYTDQAAFQSAAAKVRERSRKKYGTGFTMSAKDGILSEKDIYALYQYKSSHASFPLNSILRGEAPMTEEYRQITHDIDQALLKLPTYQGTVYRSLRSGEMVDVEAFWERYTPNSFVIEGAFTSSSTDVYDETMDIQMIIQSKRGCDMRKYNKLEQEILFKRGSMFFVEKREGNTLWLTEI